MCILRDKTYKFYTKLTPVIMGLLFCNLSFANIPATIKQEQEDILSRESEIQRQLEQEFRNLRPPLTLELDKRKPKPAKAEQRKRFVFQKIILKNATLISKRKQKQIISPFLNKKISLNDINNIIRKFTNIYLEKGLVTSRVYIETQNLFQGTLYLTVIEGQVENITVKENSQIRAGYLNAIPSVENKILNMRDLEQGIDQINTLKSHSPQINIEPGTSPGKSFVVINDEVTKPWYMTFAADNHGSTLTGKQQGEVRFEFEDAFNIYDSWSVFYRHNLRSEKSTKQSRNLMIQGAVPYGYWTFRFSGSKFDHFSVLNKPPTSTQYSGTTKNYRTEVERIIHRNSVGKTGGALALSSKNIHTDTEGTTVEIQKHQLTVASARLFHIQRLCGGVFISSFQYSKGLKILGALRDKTFDLGPEKAQFEKYNLDISYSYPFKFANRDFLYSIQSYFQYSPDKLFSDEQISIGGIHTVRGFDRNINEETGAYIRNELVYYFYESTNSNTKKLFGNIEIFLGFDVGDVKNGDTYDKRVLSGIAAGLRLKQGLFFGEAFYSHHLTKPPTMHTSKSLAYFRLGISF